MDIHVNTTEVQANLAELPYKLDAALTIWGETVAKKWETEAKHNRPWTDRTNRARLGLTGSSGMEPKGLKIVLAHTVDYGVWLELAHEKRFAIVEPTVRLESNEAIRGLNRLLDKVKL